MQNEWFQLWANLPGIGMQWAGWLHTDRLRAAGLSAALKACAPVNYTVLDENGNPVDIGLTLPFPLPFPQ